MRYVQGNRLPPGLRSQVENVYFRDVVPLVRLRLLQAYRFAVCADTGGLAEHRRPRDADDAVQQLLPLPTLAQQRLINAELRRDTDPGTADHLQNLRAVRGANAMRYVRGDRLAAGAKGQIWRAYFRHHGTAGLASSERILSQYMFAITGCGLAAENRRPRRLDMAVDAAELPTLQAQRGFNAEREIARQQQVDANVNRSPQLIVTEVEINRHARRIAGHRYVLASYLPAARQRICMIRWAPFALAAASAAEQQAWLRTHLIRITRFNRPHRRQRPILTAGSAADRPDIEQYVEIRHGWRYIPAIYLTSELQSYCLQRWGGALSQSHIGSLTAREWLRTHLVRLTRSNGVHAVARPIIVNPDTATNHQRRGNAPDVPSGAVLNDLLVDDSWSDSAALDTAATHVSRAPDNGVVILESHDPMRLALVSRKLLTPAGHSAGWDRWPVPIKTLRAALATIGPTGYRLLVGLLDLPIERVLLGMYQLTFHRVASFTWDEIMPKIQAAYGAIYCEWGYPSIQWRWHPVNSDREHSAEPARIEDCVYVDPNELRLRHIDLGGDIGKDNPNSRQPRRQRRGS